jgi:hypothetical protein
MLRFGIAGLFGYFTWIIPFTGLALLMSLNIVKMGIGFLLIWGWYKVANSI